MKKIDHNLARIEKREKAAKVSDHGCLVLKLCPSDHASVKWVHRSLHPDYPANRREVRPHGSEMKNQRKAWPLEMIIHVESHG